MTFKSEFLIMFLLETCYLSWSFVCVQRHVQKFLPRHTQLLSHPPLFILVSEIKDLKEKRRYFENLQHPLNINSYFIILQTNTLWITYSIEIWYLYKFHGLKNVKSASSSTFCWNHSWHDILWCFPYKIA